MAANLVQIVDSIGSSPTVQLDLNNENPWSVAEFDAPPPPLLYTTARSALVDSERISSSVYGNRQITMTFDLISSSQDNWAAAFQTLARLIDQDTFWLKYQPTGMTAPVFFKCYRTPADQIEDIRGATAYRQIRVTIPAYYAARGLRHDVTAAATVNNDPAAGSNGLFVDVTGVRGDIPADCVIWTPAVIGVVAHEIAPTGGIYFVQAESGVLGGDMTLAAANDAAMSGAGNNYTRTAFAVTALSQRLTGLPVNAPIGDYRVWVRLRSAAAINISVRGGIGPSGSASTWTGDTVTADFPGGGFKMVDLGVFRVGVAVQIDSYVGLDVPAVADVNHFRVDMGRNSGGGNLDIDYVWFVPASLAYAQAAIGSTATVSSFVLDGVNGQVYWLSTAGPYTGTPKIVSPDGNNAPSYVGALPRLVPNVTNRIHWLQTGSTAKTATSTVNVSYWPHYLYVRPATT
jgi:hypothetical protein